MSIPAELVLRARHVDILATAERFVQLKRVSAIERCGPCPVCGGVDRFSINFKKQVWHCRGCGKGGDVISLVQHAEGTTFAEAVASLAGEEWRKLASAPRAPDRRRAEDDEGERRQHQKARWLWGQIRPLVGSVAERYLREARGYGGPLPATLGFLEPARPEYHPSLIAAFAMPDEPEPGVLAAPKDIGSVLLIGLKPDGSGKADVDHPKKTIGSPAGLPIAVAPVNDLLGLAITEGLEDALSVAEATGLGVWAAGGASFMPKLAAAVPSYVECVTIFAHADQAGRKGARDLERLLVNRGIEVRLDEGGG
jgi:putative DNA primase/helicase